MSSVTYKLTSQSRGKFLRCTFVRERTTSVEETLQASLFSFCVEFLKNVENVLSKVNMNVCIAE